MPKIRTLFFFLLLTVLPVMVHASHLNPSRHHQSSSATTTKEVALTFDDGPYGTSTQDVLDILAREEVHATFFLVGKNVEEYPALARQEVQQGHEVGNHTYDHSMHLTSMSLQELYAELSKTEEAIASSTGVHTVLFRPPYGRISPILRAELHLRGYTPMMWNVDPKDWDEASTTSDMIVDNVMHHLNSRMIILLHDGRDTKVGYSRANMITALPLVIQNLRKLGYTFVTVDGLTKEK